MKELYLQAFTIRDALQGNALDTTLQAVRQAGYTGLQLCGSPKEMERVGKAALRNGLRVCGSVASLEVLLNDTEAFIRLHKELGADHSGIGWHPYHTAGDVTELIEAVNRLAGRFHAEGLAFAYHNHAHEFRSFDGKQTIYEQLCNGFDPKTVTLMPDTYWMQYGGVDVRHLLERLGGRVSVLHLKDMKMTDDGPLFCEIGRGNLFWDGILPLAEQAGVRHYVVEQDACEGDPLESMRVSRRFLASYIKEQ